MEHKMFRLMLNAARHSALGNHGRADNLYALVETMLADLRAQNTAAHVRGGK